MALGKLGVWYGADKLQPDQWIDFVTTVERLGYDTQWYSESTGFESMALGSFLLSHTTRLQVGSSIANIYARDAMASRNGMTTLNRIAELTRGAIPYNVTPTHTAQARTILGPDKWLAVEQKICLDTNTNRALELARAELARYMVLPNYRNNWLRQGFTEQDLQDGGSERFLNAMVVWGNEATIQARLQEHFDAGATQVCIQPVHPQGDVERAKAMLEAFAPAGGHV